MDESDPAVSVVARSEQLRAGDTATIEATLRSGSCVLVCTVRHHYVREQMVATFTVT